MIDARFVSISQWPGRATPAASQREARFRTSYADTLDLLEAELNALSARNITIQAFFRAADIRNDGWPRSSAVPTAPGLVLSFDLLDKWDAVTRTRSVKASLSFPCDTFSTFDDNLRAIALTLEALRKIDRYGVAKREEQYTGWKQLPASQSDDSDRPFTCREDANDFIAKHAEMACIVGNVASQAVAYRRAAARLHPDNKATGNHDLFLRLQKAKEVLGL